MYSKRLATRLGGYLGVTGKSAWGSKGRELDLEALRGHSPVITSCLDFTETAVPNATALGDTPLSWTVTTTGVVAGNSIVGNPLNGYLLITPGSAADTGYVLQGQTTDVPPADVLQVGAGSGSNVTMTTVFDRFWGARVAFSTSATWDGAVFMGYSGIDTTPLSTTTGQPSITNCFGFNIDNTGTISLVKAVTASNVFANLTKTANNLARANTNFTAADFHDFFFVTRYVSASTGAAVHWIEGYLDGVLVATHTNVTLPSLTSVALYNTIAIYNGDAATCTMAVANLINGTARRHLGAE